MSLEVSKIKRANRPFLLITLLLIVGSFGTGVGPGLAIGLWITGKVTLDIQRRTQPSESDDKEFRDNFNYHAAQTRKRMQMVVTVRAIVGLVLYCAAAIVALAACKKTPKIEIGIIVAVWLLLGVAGAYYAYN